ncbi:MAG: YceD family protein [Cellvibrionaceae bacterium]
MSIGTHNQFLPQSVDARKFAHQGVDLGGELKLERLIRFQEAIVASISPLVAELRFDLDASRHRVLTGTIKGEVSVICQRCMQPMTFCINTRLAIGIVSTEEAIKQLPKGLEPWLVDSEDGSADLYEVLEDELLLALPMVAYHEEQCVDKALYSSGVDDLEDREVPKKSKVNPFSVLEGLKEDLKKT